MAHKMRNVAVKINCPHCLKEAKLIFQADSRREAIRRFKSGKAKWFVEEERAVRCMRKHLFSCLHYYDFEKELWRSIRTTNILERNFREMRRRTRPMNNFFTFLYETLRAEFARRIHVPGLANILGGHSPTPKNTAFPSNKYIVHPIYWSPRK